MPRSRRAVWMLTLLLLTCWSVPQAFAQRTRYTNTVNTRFATVSNGPQNTLIVDVPRNAGAADIEQAIAAKVRAEWNAKSRSLSQALAAWERTGAMPRNSTFPISSLVMVRKDGTLVSPRPGSPTRGRQVGGGTLTFRYTGFNDTDRTLLEGFIALALPRIEAVYGRPAVSGEVEIVNAGNLFNSQLPEVRRFAYGVYDISNNRILLPLFQNPRGSLQALLLNLVHAFHGRAAFQYDAWEQGFARAVSAVVLRDPIFNQQYGLDDPSANFLYSLLPYYDILNQPPLGNSTFFPPSQNDIPIDGQITVAKMLWARIGMSGAAWLKVYIENPNFFRQFNEAYYQQVNPNAPALAGNVPALKQIAAASLPNGVEGVAWNDWYARQFVLDTSVSPGQKLFAFTLPGLRDSEGRQSAAITLVYYRTEPSGDEALLDGRAYATYFDATNARLNLGPQAESAVIVNGEGGLTATTTNAAGTDATRLTLNFTVNNVSARTYLPVGFDGDFQGVLLLNNSAQRVTVRQISLPPVQTRLRENLPVEGASFAASLGAPLGDLSITEIEVSDGTNIRRWRVNTGDGQYYAILRDGVRGGGVVTLNKTFQTGAVPHLVTFPLRPLDSNPSVALGLSASDFLLTYWNPLRPAYETIGGTTQIAPLEVGRGYWLKLAPQSGASQVTVNLTGIAPPTDTDLLIPCVFGWNLIGSPFEQPIEISRLLVKVLQNDPIPWQDAVSQNLVAAQPYAFDRVTEEYREVTGLAGDWQGYWIRVFAPSGVTLLLPGPDTAQGRAALVPLRTTRSSGAGSDARQVSAKPDWSVRIQAQQGGSNRSPEVRLGTAAKATRGWDANLDRELPPAVTPGLVMQFAGTEGEKASGGRIVADYRPGSGIGTEWNLNLTTPISGPVTLYWDGLGAVNRRTDLVLVDTVTGERTPLRSRSAYSFTAKAGESRVLRVVSESVSSVPLQITGFTSVPSRATGSVVLTGSVSRSASVSAEVSSLNGRMVRRLATTRSAEGGSFRISWDGRSQDGSALPPGAYNIVITAQTDDGNRVQVRRVISVLR
ncbi:MAG: hypothetical protein OHK0029_37650 [Armatimonadaceae bacterium]